MSDLKRAFNLVADNDNVGRVVAQGSLATQYPTQYAIIELISDHSFITETWTERSAVKVSNSLRIGDECVLTILNNTAAVWFPSQKQSVPQQQRLSQQPQHPSLRKTHNEPYSGGDVRRGIVRKVISGDTTSVPSTIGCYSSSTTTPTTAVI